MPLTKDFAGSFMALADAMNPGVKPPRKFGEFQTFLDRELESLEGVRDQIVRFAADPAPRRPLCFAVFGPPGSGKSMAAQQIAEQAQEEIIRQIAAGKTASGATRTELDFKVLNLTQFSESVEVAETLVGWTSKAPKDTLTVVFFDEFDAPRGPARWGWLSWFLAPMNDGTVVLRGATIPCKRAVYLFAGGTADSFVDFCEPVDTRSFRDAKGPDFVSRLRGYVDVFGPNDAPREQRRAVLIPKFLKRRPEIGAVDEDLARSLLGVGRYRHGVRSIEAVLETCSAPKPGEPIVHSGLPEQHILGIHADLGPLDPVRVGGLLALSGGGDKDQQDAMLKCWNTLAPALWSQGATIAYGGNPDRGGLTDLLRLSTSTIPLALRGDRASGGEADLKLAWYPPGLATGSDLGDRSEGMRRMPTHCLGDAKRGRLNPWLAQVADLFLMRLQVTEASVARVALGGKVEGWSGRMPGIVEEVVLSLACGQPVYLLGGFGGAASLVGFHLGLGRPWSGAPGGWPDLEPGREREIEAIADLLRPPPLRELPVTKGDTLEFLASHSIAGPGWPDNGLSPADNRRLFSSESSSEAIELILRGLKRVMAVR